MSVDVAETSMLNDRPIIGILSQEVPRSLRRAFGNYTSYIAASYVKYWEAAGARVVPIRINQPRSYYRQLFSGLNGLVFPGGSAKLDVSGYGRAARILWDMAAQEPKDFFPIWGTCLGFELLTFLELNERRLDRCKSQNQALPLEFTADGFTSRMFSGTSKALLKAFMEQNVTINFHKYCVSPETYRNTSLSRNYRLIATNRDWDGQVFVSAFEHRIRPVYGVQFHPEKNIFEWGEKTSISAIPHWPEAIQASQYLADFFISEVRKNRHRFPSAAEEHKHLIYNYKTEYTGLIGSVFVQCYLFD
ncbi:LOW QUALITY PROTEIN: gamma-glutamyl hydrolase-like [Pollicipes pollicipes]|uniref:LOW QUALITY PROTEIN: gamma-glutamyl hydrolase-like n=1 Tax=Pollicipes pollicipes TaxID=41117 RepID=UPI0018852215|nr:LOW QUALITY PROTEIN: gamma-glutamyl hydrolase-like [Pollicipes pollicipes]